ncbi:MAG: hypothetical protein A2X64_10715 [Ignavibacteria bacterium GWF2_33_9]|nr:MAG: hypothetical protein A2X64_10715 [Ignavibacteria bacterium GWF2_33_9]
MDFTLDFDGQKILIEKVYHRKNQIRLTVNKDLQVKIFCSKSTPDYFLLDFIRKREKWIQKHIGKFQEKKVVHEALYTEGSSFRYLGKKYSLHFINRAENYIEIFEDKIIIASAELIEKDKAESILKHWLTQSGKKYFPPIVDKYLAMLSKYNLSIETLYIRPMTSRWGTCNLRSKKITLNALLMQEHPDFIEYVILHELCHLKHPNHSKRFYNFVAEFMPNWQENRRLRGK